MGTSHFFAPKNVYCPWIFKLPGKESLWSEWCEALTTEQHFSLYFRQKRNPFCITNQPVKFIFPLLTETNPFPTPQEWTLNFITGQMAIHQGKKAGKKWPWFVLFTHFPLLLRLRHGKVSRLRPLWENDTIGTPVFIRTCVAQRRQFCKVDFFKSAASLFFVAQKVTTSVTGGKRGQAKQPYFLWATEGHSHWRVSKGCCV